jgi:signal transduction histidine kinase
MVSGTRPPAEPLVADSARVASTPPTVPPGSRTEASGAGRTGTVVFRIAFLLYAAGLVCWLVLGLLPTLADLIPAFRAWLETLAAGGGPLAAPAGRILHPEPDMAPVPTGQALLLYAFSVLNLALGLMLAIRAWDGSHRRVPRLLAFALLGTAATFNASSHRAFHITGSPWPVALIHLTFHVVSGVAYLWAVLLFPDGAVPSRLRLPPLILRTVIVAATLGGLAIGWQSSFLSHPQFFVVFFGIGVALLGVAASVVRLLDAGTSPVDRAASRLLCSALLPGLAVAVFWCVALLGWRLLGSRSAQGWTSWAQNAFPAAFAVVPMVLFAAVQRYRLWDIDRLLSRVLVYGALGAAVSAAYVAAVTAGGLLVGGSVWWVVVALSAIAVAVEPARRLAGRLVNRVVYGRHIGPTEAMAELLTGLQQLSPTAILDQLAGVALRATRARSVALYVVDGDRLARVAVAPSGADARDRTGTNRHVGPGENLSTDMPSEAGLHAAEADPLSALRAALVIPVRRDDDLLGVLAAAGEHLTAADRAFLADIAGHAGLLLHNALLTDLLEQHVAALHRSAERLRVARRKLVAAQDLERERLERNLHDGSQQYLVAAIIGLRWDGDTRRAEETLAAARSDLTTLASGAPPRTLTGGIAGALQRSAELARRSGVRVVVSVVDDRETAEIFAINAPGQLAAEEAAYFCCVEALQNAMKHAAAQTISIHVRLTDDDLALLVSDDGRGFDVGQVADGGLDGLADRVGALGGWIAVESAPGAGTTMVGRIPVAEISDPGDRVDRSEGVRSAPPGAEQEAGS